MVGTPTGLSALERIKNFGLWCGKLSKQRIRRPCLNKHIDAQSDRKTFLLVQVNHRFQHLCVPLFRRVVRVHRLLAHPGGDFADLPGETLALVSIGNSVSSLTQANAANIGLIDLGANALATDVAYDRDDARIGLRNGLADMAQDPQNRTIDGSGANSAVRSATLTCCTG